jgi:6-phosphogluconate dehydrogenase
MRDGLGMSAAGMHDVFADWNRGELDSYLIQITSEILSYKDDDGGPLVEKILDTAGQKGTGKWTSVSALDLGMPVTLIGEAVFARCLSAMKEERESASKVMKGPSARIRGKAKVVIEDLRQGLLASKIVSYAQGYMLLREAAKEYHWNLNYGGIALMWRGGCIIRIAFLGRIRDAFDRNPALSNLMLDTYFMDVISRCQNSWRRTVAAAFQQGIPIPAFSTALSFYDGYRTARLPANLLQAQRDYFGAHTYERLDRPRGQFFHTNWTGQGMDVSSRNYNA